MTASPEPYADAVAAFDAGNLAWGHFRHETLPAHPSAATNVVEEIRDALGDAAVAIIDLQAGESPNSFRTALIATLELLEGYREALRPEVPRDDIDAAHELLTEALTALGGV